MWTFELKKIVDLKIVDLKPIPTICENFQEVCWVSMSLAVERQSYTIGEMWWVVDETSYLFGGAGVKRFIMCSWFILLLLILKGRSYEAPLGVPEWLRG